VTIDSLTSMAPGSTIGILGGGQLGQMLAIEAKRRGYHVVVRTDEPSGGPAAQVADVEVLGSYNDTLANETFVEQVAVVTSEFENLPASLLDSLTAHVPVRPHSYSLHVCQHREREKLFLASQGVPHAAFAVVASSSQAIVAFSSFGTKCVLKTAAFGYDGKGQVVLGPGDDAADAFATLGVERAVLEQWVPFVKEISVVGARGVDGSWIAFPPTENKHTDGILDYSLAPARIDEAIATEANLLAQRIADALEHVGTLAIEFFVLVDGSLVVNEIAPRPHNSGHHTIDSCVHSQFALQLLAVTGQSFAEGSPVLSDVPSGLLQHTSAAMVNLLGDLWENGEPNWDFALHPRAHLHLYGKATARVGRKMGHLTVLGDTVETALAHAIALRDKLDTRVTSTTATATSNS
jgi:5-(carboxyamino)imidazole ribonucleotide synthase